MRSLHVLDFPHDLTGVLVILIDISVFSNLVFDIYELKEKSMSHGILQPSNIDCYLKVLKHRIYTKSALTEALRAIYSIDISEKLKRYTKENHQKLL